MALTKGNFRLRFGYILTRPFSAAHFKFPSNNECSGNPVNTKKFTSHGNSSSKKHTTPQTTTKPTSISNDATGFSLDNPSTVRKVLTPDNISLKRTPPSGSVPVLEYGLERVLFNQGVHWLQDPRTNVYNFDPYLKHIIAAQDFNFDSVPPFIPASKDVKLMEKASNNDCTFITSTSSISGSLASIFFVLMKMQPLYLDNLSLNFVNEPRTHTTLTRSPTSVLLKPHPGGIRSIVVEKPHEEQDNILQKMGQVMERLLTEPKENYTRMFMNSKEKPLIRDEEAYSYTVAGKLFLRSQLDCQDPRLPKKTFDLKTRASLPIRMDIANWANYRDYRLTTKNGLYGSFEREYFDMCRSAFLKYNFQVRIGNMDGIFVAYHNVFEMFGFQYVSKEEMDERLYGNSATGDDCFNLLMQIYNLILETIVPQYPSDKLLRLTFVPDKFGHGLRIFSEEATGHGSPKGNNIKQFNCTLNSTVNDSRPEKLIVEADGSDTWKVNMAITHMATNLQDYTSAREKITEKRGDIDVDDARIRSFLRIIQQYSSSSGVDSNKNPIIAPWTRL